MKKILVLIILSLALPSRSEGISEETPRLPPSWIFEDASKEPSSYKLASVESLSRLENPSSDFTAATEQLLDDNAQALEAAEVSPPESKWHLQAVLQDLALSAQGALGLLVMKGSAAITLYWKKHKDPNLTEIPADSAPMDASVDFSTLKSGDLETSLSPVIRASMATGKIENELTFRKNLMTKARDFLRIADAVESLTQGAWTVSKLRLDLSVGASGTVMEGVTVGGALKLRFEWQPTGKLSSTRPVEGELARKIQMMILVLAADLNSLPVELLNPPGFAIDHWKFGLGMTAKGDVGIAKGNAGIVAYVYMKKNPTGSMVLVPSSTELNLISAKTEKSTIERRVFKKGLERALKMAGYFARRTNRDDDRKWGVYQMKAAFTLSVSGLLSVATITGSSEAEVCLKKTHF